MFLYTSKSIWLKIFRVTGNWVTQFLTPQCTFMLHVMSKKMIRKMELLLYEKILGELGFFGLESQLRD